MKNAQKPDHISLDTLISRLKNGHYVIPDFQREFEWNPWDIKELMRSIFLDYYIGSLLLWRSKRENFSALSCESLYGHPDKDSAAFNHADSIVLDGQQRLSAMYYAFVAPDLPLPRKKSPALYYIRVDRFMAEEYDDAFHYDWKTKRFLRLLENKEEQYFQHIFPLSIIGAGGWELANWVQGYAKFWEEKAKEAKESFGSANEQIATENAENARNFGDHIREITQQYQISYIELDSELAIDKVCDIFTQINSRGIRLDVFDLMNAILKPKDLQLKKMWHEAQPKLTFVETDRMNVYILQVMSILCQAYCSPKYLYFLLPGQEKPVRDPDGTRHKEILVRDNQEFIEKWNGAVEALETTIKLLNHPQEFGVISPKYLPYASILPVFAALQVHVGTLPANRRLNAKRKIQHYYWASVFTNRYSGSVESTSARDFLDVKAWLDNDSAEPGLIEEFKVRFANLDLHREIKRGGSVYNGIFNLLIIHGARDWITGAAPQHDDLDDHHIIPASWGEANLQKNEINTILNRTPLTEDTNRNVIRDRLPNVYLPELMAENGESHVRSVLESHFISPAALEILLRDPFTPDDFNAFISERQRTIQQAVESLLIKERLDLPPQLRELDERIEQIELSLRRIITTTFENDPKILPQQFLQKADERIMTAAKKNPAMDAENYQTLAEKLEYCDLREIQSMMVGKVMWSHFEPHFKNRIILDKEFNQLAELRNSIRHSRSVDEFTRKEGEAAIMWFEQVIGSLCGCDD